MWLKNKLDFQDINDFLSVTTKRIPGGILVYLTHNDNSTNLPVSDIILSRHIGTAMYKAFYLLINNRHEKYDQLDFYEPILNLNVNALEFDLATNKLQTFPTGSFIELLRYLKSLHALILTVITDFDWYSYQNDSLLLIRSDNISNYIDSALKFIIARSVRVNSEFCSYLLEQFRYVHHLFPDDKRITIAYGIDLPTTVLSANNQTWQSLLTDNTSWILWIVLIIIVIFIIVVGFWLIIKNH